jgi:indolepyruvate ferredoxin oxidoreductase beta subunit
MTNQVTNVIVAGLGGQGVIKASDILADVAFRAGLDVKKAEVHGMSQRGGSVSTDVRFGPQVLSPMVPAGEADFLVVLASDQVENNRWVLRPGGVMVVPDNINEADLANRKSANIALLGVLSRHLPFAQELWHASLQANLPAPLLAANMQAFEIGRRAASSGTAAA